MKTVLLIGDSIRASYDRAVREALRGGAEVFFPRENCRFAQYVLRNLHEWKQAENVPDSLDLIHWNAGLWDTLRLFGDEPMTPPEIYAAYLERICRRIRLLFPQAKMTFALSTPVLEHRFPDPKACFRRNADIREYNAIAERVIHVHGGEINDLYRVLDGVPDSYYSDMTHPYTKAGGRLLTEAVLRSVCVSLRLPLPAEQPSLPDFLPSGALGL